MVRVNKKQLSEDLRAKAWGRFLAAVRVSSSEEALRKKLASFLTPAELVMLEKRLAIPILIERGLSYREIGRMLDISSNTISFVKYKLVRNPLRGELKTLRKLRG